MRDFRLETATNRLQMEQSFAEPKSIALYRLKTSELDLRLFRLSILILNHKKIRTCCNFEFSFYFIYSFKILHNSVSVKLE